MRANQQTRNNWIIANMVIFEDIWYGTVKSGFKLLCEMSCDVMMSDDFVPHMYTAKSSTANKYVIKNKEYTAQDI